MRPRIRMALLGCAALSCGCEQQSIRVIQHVPDTVEPLPPLARTTPFPVHVGGFDGMDPFAWFQSGSEELETWTKQQLTFSRAVLEHVPGRGTTETRVQSTGASPARITELRGTRDGIFYVLPDGRGGATAPAHLMHTAAVGAAELAGVEQPAAIRPSPDGKLVATGRAGDASARSVVLVDAEARRVESIQHAVARSVAWARDGKSFYYVGYLGEIQAVLHHVVGEPSSRDRQLFGGAAFGRDRIDAGDTLAIALGDKTITVEISARRFGTSFTSLYTSARAFVESSDPAWREVTPKAGLEAPLAHGDALFLFPKGGERKGTLLRVDLNQAAPGEPFGGPGAPVDAAAEAEDALYVARDGKISRLALTNGDEQPLDVPDGLRAVAVEANPFVPGARVFFSSCTGGGWFGYRAGSRSAEPLALDRRVANGAQIETRTLEVRDGAPKVTLVVRRGLGGGVHPTVLFPHGCHSYSPELAPWLESGGVAAFCDVAPIEATTSAAVVAGRKRQADALRACAHALVEEKIATRNTLGIRGSGADGITILAALNEEPGLVGAVAIGRGVFDARNAPQPEALPEHRVRDADPAALAGALPYLRMNKALPPFLLVLPRDPKDPGNVQSLKLAARLGLFNRDEAAALVVRPEGADDGKRGPNGAASVVADVDAFMTAALAPAGGGLSRYAQRADRIYENRHRPQPAER